MLALLTYLRETKVTGTSAAGNFHLKAVAEICARLVEPVALERKEGDKIRKVRSEMEVWPLCNLGSICIQRTKAFYQILLSSAATNCGDQTVGEGRQFLVYIRQGH